MLLIITCRRHVPMSASQNRIGFILSLGLLDIDVNMQFSRYNLFDSFAVSGDKGIRTLDPLLARQVLSQLSYTPMNPGTHLSSHTVSSIVLSAACGLTIVFGMGTGVSHKRIDTGNLYSVPFQKPS